MNRTAFEIGLGFGGFATVMSLATLLVLYPIYKCINASGESDYCYIVSSPRWGTPDTFATVQHVPWRFDRMVGDSKSFDEAKTIADKMNCSLK